MNISTFMTGITSINTRAGKAPSRTDTRTGTKR